MHLNVKLEFGEKTAALFAVAVRRLLLLHRREIKAVPVQKRQLFRLPIRRLNSFRQQLLACMMPRQSLHQSHGEQAHVHHLQASHHAGSAGKTTS